MATRDIIESYHAAWTSGDLKRARRLLADDLDFQGAIETHKTGDGFLGGLTMFREQLYQDHTNLEQVFGDDTGFVLYDCTLKTGETLRCAEFFRVGDGKIQQIRLVFDTAKVPHP